MWHGAGVGRAQPGYRVGPPNGPLNVPDPWPWLAHQNLVPGARLQQRRNGRGLKAPWCVRVRAVPVVGARTRGSGGGRVPAAHSRLRQP